jgi:quercetin dioxygenase-like cupin family protein
MASNDPIVVHPGEGELLFDDESGSSRIKVARDELLLSETSSTVEARRVRPHIHREHADAFSVLEGSLDFQVAGEQRTLEAGALVLAPPDLVHGFQVGPNGDRHLNIHAPGAAFAKLSRARRDGVPVDAGAEGDTFSPPGDGGRPATDAVVSHAGEGERLPEIARFLLKAAHPQLAVLEFDVEAGFGGSPHIHKEHHDTYYVLAGKVEFGLDGETAVGSRGAVVSIPPGVVHVWTNTGSGRARFLNLHAPGTWFERYIRERAEIETAGGEPDRAFFERHDIFDV